MPIRKRATAVPERPVPCASHWPCAFWTVFAFLLLFGAVFVIGSIIILLYRQQIDIVRYIDALNGQTVQTSRSMAQPQDQYQEADVKGLYLAYQSCRPTFTGACDDASLYRLAADGSKQVIIPSLRKLPGAPLTNELFQPIEQSSGGRYIVFGAWAFGSERNPNDHRIWVYDTANSTLAVSSDVVPSGAIFSPDYAYAAYASQSDGDLRDVMIVNLAEDKTVSGAKADKNMTFKGPDGQASLVWTDAKDLTIRVYTQPDAQNPVATEHGEITVKVK